VRTARRQRLTKLRRKMRLAHGVEIEVLAAELGEPRAPQEVLAFTEERGRPVAMDLAISPAVVSNLTVTTAGRQCIQICRIEEAGDICNARITEPRSAMGMRTITGSDYTWNSSCATLGRMKPRRVALWVSPGDGAA
jgi:hypothetical protein